MTDQLQESIDPLTEEEGRAVDDLRASIGARLDVPDPHRTIWGQYPYYTQINRDAAHHYALGMGDTNPLWTDGAYAETSVVGGLTAPPAIVFALGGGGLSGAIFNGLDTMFGDSETWGGADITWCDRLRAGTDVNAVSHLTDVDMVRGSSGPMVKLTAETTVDDKATGQTLATVRTWVFRKRSGPGSQAATGRTLKHWNPDEIKVLERHALSHRRRGAEPLDTSDLQVGDTLHLLKGPLTIGACVAFIGGWQGQFGGRGDIPWEDLSDFGVGAQGIPEERHVIGHYDRLAAERKGLPGPYDCGPQRVSWASQLITDWIGDAGFLEHLTFQVRDFNFVGDLQRFTGTVSEVRSEGGVARISIFIECRNQDDRLTGRGRAVVTVPSVTQEGHDS